MTPGDEKAIFFTVVCVIIAILTLLAKYVSIMV